MPPLTADFRPRCRSRESSERGATAAALPTSEVWWTGELSKENSAVSYSNFFPNERWSSAVRVRPSPIQDGSFSVGCRIRSRFFSSSRFHRPTRVNQGLETGIVPALGGYAVFVGTSQN